MVNGFFLCLWELLLSMKVAFFKCENKACYYQIIHIIKMQVKI